jgi:hypothetical protein
VLHRCTHAELILAERPCLSRGIDPEVAYWLVCIVLRGSLVPSHVCGPLTVMLLLRRRPARAEDMELSGVLQLHRRLDHDGLSFPNCRGEDL